MAQPKRFVVAPGISTHGERGILDQGKEVMPSDFEGGQTAFDELVKRGVLVPAPVAKPEEPPAAPPAPAPQEAEAAPEPTSPEPAAPEPTQESANARQSRSRTVR
jgi:hypothetical protein